MTQDNRLAEAVAQCREDEVKALLREKLAGGVPAAEVLAECNRGMVELGNRFNQGECFLPDLMFGGMIMKGIMAELEPHLVGSSEPAAKATAVMGTVQYDVHDIGKDIVVMMLRGAGFAVIDLGVDVSPARFVEAIRKHQPSVVGISILLTTCFKSVVATVAAIREAGLRDKVSIMVGGAAASELLSTNAGCDFYGRTAVDGMKYACQIAAVARPA
jgi:5-methyltetrahydrofolate--homocysteine methyltransferase